jgi:hypothetical protein
MFQKKTPKSYITWQKSQKPFGEKTRGKTAANRLRKVDYLLLRYDPWFLSTCVHKYGRLNMVDLGYGQYATTTLETLERIGSFYPMHITGYEIDPKRVADAKIHNSKYASFQLGGFNFALQNGITQQIDIIRAFNVLRQYQEEDTKKAYQLLSVALRENGILLEGTSDPFGRIWTANIFRKKDGYLVYEACVFGTNFRYIPSPRDFQTILPKIFIHHVVAPHPIFYFFYHWQNCYQKAQRWKSWSNKQVLLASIKELSFLGYHIEIRRCWLNRGYFIFYEKFGLDPLA